MGSIVRVRRRRSARAPLQRLFLALGPAVALGAAACAPGPLPPPAPLIVTLARPIGSWAGRGGYQTEFFYSEHGKFRVHWEARALTPSGALMPPEDDTPPATQPTTPRLLEGAPMRRNVESANPDEVGPYFELKLQSGVSGRQLGHAIERRNSGRGVLMFDEDPRDFYFAVRANDMEWAFRVEELFISQVMPSAAASLATTP